MWGNALGWTISLVILIATAGFVAWLDRAARATSPPTAFSQDRSNAADVLLPVSPMTIVPEMADPTDAREVYRLAIAEYEKSPTVYGQFSRTGRENDIEDVPAIKILVQGTHSRLARLFSANPSEIVNLNNEQPVLEALRTLGACAIRAGMLIEKDHPADAMQLYEAVFSLGVKLYRERLTYAELDTGLSLLAQGSSSIGSLAEKAGNAPRAEAAKRFDQARIAYVNEHVLPVMRIIGSADQATLEKHAGDVLYFARYAGERMWRVEAIFSLGRYRFNAGRIGDQSVAMKEVRELADDPDPVTRAAAIAARDLTIEQYRMLK